MLVQSHHKIIAVGNERHLFVDEFEELRYFYRRNMIAGNHNILWNLSQREQILHFNNGCICQLLIHRLWFRAGGNNDVFSAYFLSVNSHRMIRSYHRIARNHVYSVFIEQITYARPKFARYFFRSCFYFLPIKSEVMFEDAIDAKLVGMFYFVE